MAPRRDPAGSRTRRCLPARRAKRPPGVSAEEPSQLRRSARLKAISTFRAANREDKQGSTAAAVRAPEEPKPVEPTSNPRKRTAARQTERSSAQAQNTRPSKRRLRSTGIPPAEIAPEEEHTTNQVIVHPIATWVTEGKWPPELLEPGTLVEEDHLGEDSYFEGRPMKAPPVVTYVTINGIAYPRPIPRTSTTRKRSGAALTGIDAQNLIECKSIPYRNPYYGDSLEKHMSFMYDCDDGVPQDMTHLCEHLLDREQHVHRDSMFRDSMFEKLRRWIAGRNESMIIRHITPLLVPSAMELATYGDTHLNGLIETANERWINCIPVEGPRPQPDYSAGFARSAFTSEQWEKLDPFLGCVTASSYFTATGRMYFPFLTCEVKPAAVTLDIADRQNAHSMTVAMRGVVELFKLVKREEELHHKILAFSISHNHEMVKIYGHYPVVKDSEHISFYRHEIHQFLFKTCRERWTSYKFVRNVYDVWMPEHFKFLCSVIDQLPANVSFEVNGSDIETSQILSAAGDVARSQGDSDGPLEFPSGSNQNTSVNRKGRQAKK